MVSDLISCVELITAAIDTIESTYSFIYLWHCLLITQDQLMICTIDSQKRIRLNYQRQLLELGGRTWTRNYIHKNTMPSEEGAWDTGRFFLMQWKIYRLCNVAKVRRTSRPLIAPVFFSDQIRNFCVKYRNNVMNWWTHALALVSSLWCEPCRPL